MKALYIALMCFGLCKAQSIIPIENQVNYNLTESNGKYFKDVNGVYNKFLGTWKYQNTVTNPTEIVEVIFYKQEHYFISNFYEDRLYARFKYTKNGQVIFNTLTGTDAALNRMIFGGFFINPANTNKTSLTYFEPDEERWTRKSILLLEYSVTLGNPAQLTWHLDWYPIGEGVPDPKIPANMTLTKIN